MPTGKGEPVLCRLQPELLAKVDMFISREKETISRPEAIRRLIEIGLKKR